MTTGQILELEIHAIRRRREAAVPMPDILQLDGRRLRRIGPDRWLDEGAAHGDERHGIEVLR